MPVAIFDALGTLLDLTPVRDAFPGPLEAWFERILHTGAALTLVGDFRPFAELAESTLPTALAQLGADPEEKGALEALRNEVRPAADAGRALDTLAGLPVWVLTNGGAQSTREALARGELEGRIDDIVSIDDVRAFKPHRAAYSELERRAGVAPPSELWLIAAHAWDVFAAQAYGWNAIWVESLERRWPLPGGPPELRASTLAEAAELVATRR
jgi:2-haloacid dehalogenase